MPQPLQRSKEHDAVHPHLFSRAMSASRASDGGRRDHFVIANYLIASGLTGEPTAPVIGIAGATNRNS